jgi:hypothetical protein
MIVDLRGVEARDGNGRKERGEQIGAGLGQFVEEERAAADLGQDGEQAGAGRRLQHDVARQCDRRRRQRRRDRAAPASRIAEAPALSSERRVCVGRSPAIFASSGKTCSRRCGFAEKRLSVFAQEQDCRDLAGLIGGLSSPRRPMASDAPKAVSMAERRIAASMRWPRSRWREAVAARMPRGSGRTGKRRGRKRPRETGCSWEKPRESGRDKPGGALSRPPGLNPSRPPSPLIRRHEKSARP